MAAIHRCECGLSVHVRVWPLHCACGRTWTGPQELALPGGHPGLREAPGLATRSPPPERGGPGTELTQLIHEIAGEASWSGCGCAAYAAQMDRWGVEGCRQRHAEIVAHLRGQMGKLRSQQVARAAFRVLGQRWAWPSWDRLAEAAGDPVGFVLGAILDEALRRAERAQRGGHFAPGS